MIVYINTEPHEVTATLLLDDGQPPYRGLGAQHIDFTIPDGTLGHHGILTVSAPGYQTDKRHVTIANHLADVQLQHAETGRRLMVNGLRFATDDGRPWFGLTATDFLLFNRMLRGEDITPIVQQRKAAGINEHRVTLSMGFIPSTQGWPHLRPENYGEYWTVLPQFTERMAALGQRVKLTMLCDQQQLQTSLGWQHAFVAQVVTVLRSRWNVRFELGNEFNANGWDPYQFSEPPDVFISRGSNSIDRPPPVQGWDWHELHRRRDWPKYLQAEDLGFISHGQIEGGSDVPRPVDDGEPIGFAEVEMPGRRLTSPLAARALRATAEEFAAATCYHAQAGIDSTLWPPVQDRCARAFCEDPS